MEAKNISQIKTIYAELQGYLFAAPEERDYAKESGHVYNSDIWEHFNSTLKRLNRITDDKYSHFELNERYYNIKHIDGEVETYRYISISSYRRNLAGLIFSLHADYFPNEPSPISKSESGQIVLNQDIHQEQSVSINIFKEQIEEKISSYAEGSKEKSFLEKLKGYVSTTNNITDIVRTTIGLAKKCGLSFDDISNIFS